MTDRSLPAVADRECRLLERQELGGAYALLTFEHKEIAQARAEERRAMAVAEEQEMRAKVVAAEAEVPLAIADAFRSGNIGVMDLYRMQNVQADTEMRSAIAEDRDA